LAIAIPAIVTEAVFKNPLRELPAIFALSFLNLRCMLPEVIATSDDAEIAPHFRGTARA
jgi:hypothetical protein